MKLAYPSAEAAIGAWFGRVIGTSQPEPFLDVYSPNRRVFGSGHVLYSYGNHYPLARWIPEQRSFTLNKQRYSNTTSKQQSYVERAALGWQHHPATATKDSHIYIFRLNFEEGWLPDIESESERIIIYYDNKIKEYATASRRARCEDNRYHHFNTAMNTLAERNLFVSTFDIDTTELPEDVTAALVLMKLMEK
jgi:hypothetical protein